MAMKWLSDAFHSILNIFSPNGADDRSASPIDAHSSAGNVHDEGGRGAVNQELFDNEWRRKAKEYGQQRADYYRKADEARANDDHDTANEYVEMVNV